jgi:hypothetical protein
MTLATISTLTRACSQQPDISTNEMQKDIEATGEFVVAGCDTAEPFEAVEKLLDRLVSLVSAPVGMARRLAAASRRNACFGQRGVLRDIGDQPYLTPPPPLFRRSDGPDGPSPA